MSGPKSYDYTMFRIKKEGEYVSIGSGGGRTLMQAKLLISNIHNLGHDRFPNTLVVIGKKHSIFFTRAGEAEFESLPAYSYIPSSRDLADFPECIGWRVILVDQ